MSSNLIPYLGNSLEDDDFYLGPDDLEEVANDLSSFDGNNDDHDDFREFVEYDTYTGDDDEFLDFDGEIENFAMEGSAQKQFTITIVNGDPAPKTAAIWSGYLMGIPSILPGQIKTGAFNDKGGNEGLIGSSNVEKTIEEFLAYLFLNPTRVVQMRVQSTVSTQISNEFVLRELDPFKATSAKYIRPKDFVDQNTFQDKTVTFPTDFQFDDQNSLEYQFTGNSSTTITFYCGATLNKSKALKKKAKRANRNIKLKGRRRVIKKSMKRKVQKRPTNRNRRR